MMTFEPTVTTSPTMTRLSRACLLVWMMTSQRCVLPEVEQAPDVSTAQSGNDALSTAASGGAVLPVEPMLGHDDSSRDGAPSDAGLSPSSSGARESPEITPMTAAADAGRAMSSVPQVGSQAGGMAPPMMVPERPKQLSPLDQACNTTSDCRSIYVCVKGVCKGDYDTPCRRTENALSAAAIACVERPAKPETSVTLPEIVSSRHRA